MEENEFREQIINFYIDAKVYSGLVMTQRAVQFPCISTVMALRGIGTTTFSIPPHRCTFQLNFFTKMFIPALFFRKPLLF